MTMDFAGNQSPLAGTTNLILKDKIEESATRIALGYGSYDTYGGRIYHQDHRGNFHYFMGGSYEASDYANYGTSDSWLNMIDDPEYEKSKLYLKTSYFFGREDHKISLFGHHTRHDGDAGRPNRDYHHIYDTVNVAYSNQFSERFNGQVKIGYRSYDRNWEEDNYPVDLGLRSKDGVKQQIIPMDATLSFKHFKNSLLTFGMDYQDVEYNTFSETQGISQTGNDMTASSTGLFAEEKIGWGNWIFRIGNRYNYIQHDYTRISGTTPEETEKSWDKILWSAGARCAVSPSVSIYANAGTSYQAPSAKSVGGTLKESDRGVPGRNGQLPNPDLKPESGIGSDLGLDVKLGNQWVLGLRGFYNQIEDAIVENRISENPSQSRSVNAGTTDAYGLEVEIKYRMNTRLEWFANYTLVETDVKNDVDTDQDGSNVPFVPDYTANIGLTAFLPYDISASAYVKAVGKYFDSTSKTGRKSFGPYEVVNFVLQKKLWNTEQHRSFLRLELNNLLDERFEMPWQFQDPGFASFLSWQIEF
jgi:outer membrane receptor protein involved in Fe transport